MKTILSKNNKFEEGRNAGQKIVMNGILIVDKPQGITSNKVIGRLKHACGRIKTGHTGTLDPNATGVLPVCFGNATKVCGFLTDTSKEYRAELILGIETDTYDITGSVISEKTSEISREQLSEAVQGFVGTQMQVPPMFSAKWVNGIRLYDLARDGVVIDREAKEITVDYINIEDTQLENGFVKRATLLIGCSKGTYIRSICHDLGEKLGCGACMGDLMRTRVGSFKLSDAIPLDECIKLAEEGKIAEHLISADSIYDYPSITVTTPEEAHLLKNGNRICKRSLSPVPAPGLYKMYLEDGRFAAIYELREHAKYMYPFIVFPE